LFPYYRIGLFSESINQQSWAPALFSRFRAREREAKKAREREEKKREKSESAERERKKARIRAFLSLGG
jgi:hypothetical protein